VTPTSTRVLSVALAGSVVLLACGDDDDSSARVGGFRPADTTEPAETTESTVAVETTGAAVTTAQEFTFTPTEGDYSIVFAAEPTANPQDVQLPNGATVPITFYLHETPDVAQGTAAITYGPEIVPSLEGARDGAVAALNGATLTSSEPIDQQGRSGLQFVADLRPGGTEATYVSRIFLDGQTLYQVIYVGATIDATSPEVVEFFDSFRFTVDK
jgi:hypothetical protein